MTFKKILAQKWCERRLLNKPVATSSSSSSSSFSSSAAAAAAAALKG
jgi:hypothetical protein